MLIGTTAFVCLLFWPVIRHLSSTVTGTLGSDSTGGVWWFWQLQHEGGYHLFGNTHHTLSGAPFGWAESDGLNLQWLLPYYPTYLATKVVGEIAAYNLVTLSGYVLSGTSMYFLTRYLGCARVVSAWATLVYIVFPWHLARVEHASLIHIEVLAILLIALVAVVREQTTGRFALVGAATLGAWLTSGYFGAETLITSVAFAAGAALAMGRRGGGRIVAGATVAALAATTLVAVGSFASGINRGAGLHRVAEDVSIGGLRPIELVVPADGNLVVGDSLRSFHRSHLHGTNVTEVSNYLGLLTVLLAAFWLFRAWRARAVLDRTQRATTVGLVVAVATGLVFALPSPVSLFGHDVWMPARVLWAVLPAFRAPSRWVPLVMTALIPLAALGLQALCSAIASRRRSALLPAVLVATAMLFSFFELAINPVRHRFRTTPVPPEYAAVASTPRGILAEYPLGTADVYRFWQRRHGRPLVNGAAAGTTSDVARLVLLDPATTGTAQALSLLGVTAIVIHKHAIVDAEVAPRAPSPQQGYVRLARYPDGDSVWRVVAAPAAAFVTLPGGFGKPRRVGDGQLGFPLVSPAGVVVIELRAKAAGVVQIAFDAEGPPGSARTLRLADENSEQRFMFDGRTHIAVAIQVPRGLSQLLVKTDPAPTSEADAIVLSAVRATRSSGEPLLQAQLLSPNPGF